ncbi:hypothetical protein Rhow_002318 [Rhodococcus wratislaviensis]|uniref:Uncharacterized protein n=1 Tax=Rhodococcus wratislaviensis TaxID=44752 RepID=A0A402C569_RHOWR|nr:hypothetical protein Rhow_002318 [Rhodococcus wratislaviensis]
MPVSAAPRRHATMLLSTMSRVMNTHRVAAPALPGVLPLDLGCTTQIFRSTPDEFSVCGASRGDVITTTGFTIRPFADLTQADTVIAPGFVTYPARRPRLHAGAARPQPPRRGRPPIGPPAPTTDHRPSRKTRVRPARRTGKRWWSWTRNWPRSTWPPPTRTGSPLTSTPHCATRGSRRRKTRRQQAGPAHRAGCGRSSPFSTSRFAAPAKRIPPVQKVISRQPSGNSKHRSRATLRVTRARRRGYLPDSTRTGGGHPRRARRPRQDAPPKAASTAGGRRR